MLTLGIGGGNDVGKSATTELVADGMTEQGDLLIVSYELSAGVEDVLSGLGVETEPRTGIVRTVMQEMMESAMRISDTIWMDAILRAAVNAYGEDIDLLIISGIRRACEASWVLDRGGKVVWIGDAPPVPAVSISLPSPVQEANREKYEAGVADLVASLVEELHDYKPAGFVE